MLIEENDKVEIICDKCGYSKTASKSDYNKVFWNAGFVLNGGRKYEHLCFNCLPKTRQKARTFLISKTNY